MASNLNHHHMIASLSYAKTKIFSHWCSNSLADLLMLIVPINKHARK